MSITDELMWGNRRCADGISPEWKTIFNDFKNRLIRLGAYDVVIETSDNNIFLDFRLKLHNQTRGFNLKSSFAVTPDFNNRTTFCLRFGDYLNKSSAESAVSKLKQINVENKEIYAADWTLSMKDKETCVLHFYSEISSTKGVDVKKHFNTMIKVLRKTKSKLWG